jgi:hypothetical protein
LTSSKKNKLDGRLAGSLFGDRRKQGVKVIGLVLELTDRYLRELEVFMNALYVSGDVSRTGSIGSFRDLCGVKHAKFCGEF